MSGLGHPNSVPGAPGYGNDPIHWVAPGRIEDQRGAEHGVTKKAIHAMQDDASWWYTVVEYATGELYISARDIPYRNEVISDMRKALRNLPGVEIFIDPAHMDEDPTGEVFPHRESQTPRSSDTAKAVRKEG